MLQRCVSSVWIKCWPPDTDLTSLFCGHVCLICSLSAQQFLHVPDHGGLRCLANGRCTCESLAFYSGHLTSLLYIIVLYSLLQHYSPQYFFLYLSAICHSIIFFNSAYMSHYHSLSLRCVPHYYSLSQHCMSQYFILCLSIIFIISLHIIIGNNHLLLNISQYFII